MDYLVGIHETTHTVFNTEDVVVDRIHVLARERLFVHDASRIEAREIQRARRLKLGNIQTEWVEEHVTTNRSIHGRRVIVRRNCGVGRVSKLVVTDIRAVDLQFQTVIRGDTGNFATTEACSGHKCLDRVVKIEFLDSGTRRNSLLHLGDDHILWLGSEHRTFFCVEVGVVRIAFPTKSVSLRTRTPRNTQFDVVVLEADQWDGGLPVFTESEAQWVELRGTRRTTKHVT